MCFGPSISSSFFRSAGRPLSLKYCLFLKVKVTNWLSIKYFSDDVFVCWLEQERNSWCLPPECDNREERRDRARLSDSTQGMATIVRIIAHHRIILLIIIDSQLELRPRSKSKKDFAFNIDSNQHIIIWCDHRLVWYNWLFNKKELNKSINGI